MQSALSNFSQILQIWILNNLWTKSCFFVKRSTNKATILLSGDFALTPNSNAAWMTDNFTHHMLGNTMMSWMAMTMSMVWTTDLMIPIFSPWFVSSSNFAGTGFLKILINISFSSTDWPFCYIIRPNVRSYRSRCFTISMGKIKLDKWQNDYLPYEILN